jgi:hypothetical protein
VRLGKDELRALVKTASEGVLRLAARPVSSDAEFTQFKTDVQAASEAIVTKFAAAFPDRDPESIFTVAPSPFGKRVIGPTTTSIPDYRWAIFAWVDRLRDWPPAI